LDFEQHGDLNGDDIDDLVFVVRETDPDKIVQKSDDCGGGFDSNPRLLGAALAERDGYRRVLADHTLIPRRDSPYLEDPLDGVVAAGVSIKHGTLQVALGRFVSFGSSSMGQTSYTFRWQSGHFVLIGYDAHSVNRASGEMDDLSVNYLTRRFKRTQGCIQHDVEAVEWASVPDQALLTLEQVGDGMAFHPEVSERSDTDGRQERPLCDDDSEDPVALGEHLDEAVPADPVPHAGKERWNWADASSDSRYEQEYEASRAICRRLRDVEPPASDWPDAAAVAALDGCDSGKLYYGIGMPADTVRARRCALLESTRDDGSELPFNGMAMLMTVYANGVGGERDLDLATALACRVNGAPFEVHGRVMHLQKLKDEGGIGQGFDFCDDITSGLSQGLCASRVASMKEAERSDKLSHLMMKWTGAERHAFAPLKAAAQAYANASSGNEVDLSGTARAAFVIEQKRRLEEEFVMLLTALESEGIAAPPDAASTFKAADAELNDVYRQIMERKAGPEGRTDYGTVTQDGIREAQRAWLRYRDAWVAFAAAKYPEGNVDELRARMTRQRVDALKVFVPLPAPPPLKPGVIRLHPLPMEAAAILERARGVVIGAEAGASPAFQVIFDPNAPCDVELWRTLQHAHPELAVRWLPIAYFTADSAEVGLEILDAPAPATALDTHFQGIGHHVCHGDLPDDDADKASTNVLDPAQTALLEAWQNWGGYTPMIILRDGDGQLQRADGASPEAVEAVLEYARP
jgi:hypothetical protein